MTQNGNVPIHSRRRIRQHGHTGLRQSIPAAEGMSPKQKIDVRLGQLGRRCVIAFPEHRGQCTFFVLKAEDLLLDRVTRDEAVDKDRL